MKHGHLRIVTDNSHRPAAVAAVPPVIPARVRFATFIARIRYWFAFALVVIAAPFRFMAAIGRFCVATGQAIFDAIFKIIIGTIGFTLLVMVGYGLLRVILHPLFR